MIVAGIGSRKGVNTAEVIAAVERALEEHGLALTALSALATTAFKRNERAIVAAAHALNLPLLVVEEAAAAGTLTCSARSLEHAGTPSVSESAALTAAGDGARLFGPRTVVGPVTCALAISGDAA